MRLHDDRALVKVYRKAACTVPAPRGTLSAPMASAIAGGIVGSVDDRRSL